MSPVLERFAALATDILFGIFFLGEMGLALGHHAAHMVNIRIRVTGWIFFGIVLEDLHDLPTTRSFLISSCISYSVCDENAIMRKSGSPFMTDRLARITGPSRWLRLLT